MQRFKLTKIRFRLTVAQYSKIFEHVIALLDSDAKSQEEYKENKRQLNQIIESSGCDNISVFFANPSIEAWIVAGLNTELYKKVWRTNR